MAGGPQGSAAGFVDIHSHVLWDIDDGARDFETSLEMLRIARDCGTNDIVATPHSDLRYSFQPEEIDRKIQQLSEATANNPRLHRGCDFHLHFDNIQDCLANPTKYTINHLRYLMVEFPDTNLPATAKQVFDRMLQAGITPVITHPERNPVLNRQPESILEWVNAGCLVQVTAHSLLGRFGKRAQASAGELLSRGLVHFIASDAHGTEDRTPDLLPAFAHVAAHYGETTAAALFIHNPAAVLTGQYIEAPLPQQEPPSRKWYQFWGQ